MAYKYTFPNTNIEFGNLVDTPGSGTFGTSMDRVMILKWRLYWVSIPSSTQSKLIGTALYDICHFIYNSH